MEKKKGLNRREFLSTATKAGMGAGIGLTVLPSHVMGGSGRVAPSDRINIGLIGYGSQSRKMLPGWLDEPFFQFTSVCDPNKESYDYPDWGGPRGEVAGTAGGRDVGQRIINNYYANQTGQSNFNGCSAYSDFREMLEKEDGLDAVFIMTPDHLHASIAVAAMNKGLMLAAHKPIGNYLQETRVAINKAKSTGLATHIFAGQERFEHYLIQEWINQGAIGKLKELHRWTNRPMWPQGSPYLPDDNPPIPDGFDWDLWLGPSLPRPYSPAYTHTAFRGWHEFGAGCLADMGYYSLWNDWEILNLGMPVTAEASASVICDIREFRSSWVRNSVSFPHAATIRWEVPIKGTNDTIDAYWYEGGLRPPNLKELKDAGRKLGAEGVYYVGEKGTILAGWGNQNPQLLGVNNADEIIQSIPEPDFVETSLDDEMLAAFKGEKESRSSYPNAQVIAETICLGNLAIRADQTYRTDQILKLDPDTLRITNFTEANQFVTRNSRSGWEL